MDVNERFFLECIQRSCAEHGIELTTRSDGWLLELVKGSQKHRILGTSFDLNDQVSAAIAKDKVATSVLLMESGIKCVPHTLVKSRGGSIDMNAVRELLTQGPVVIKPLEGSRGELVDRADTEAEALNLMSQSGSTAWAISPYEDVSSEVRLVVVDSLVKLAFKKMNPVMRGKLRLFNLHMGASAEPLMLDDISEEMKELAIKTSNILGLRMAAIDVVITQRQTSLILEANAAFSLNKFARVSDVSRNQVAAFYDDVIKEMFTSL